MAMYRAAQAQCKFDQWLEDSHRLRTLLAEATARYHWLLTTSYAGDNRAWAMVDRANARITRRELALTRYNFVWARTRGRS